MNNSNNNTAANNSTIETSSNFSFNLRELIVRYLKKWYWFVLSILLFLGLAYLKIRYTIPQYNVSSTIMISQDENISESELAAFKDLGLLDNSQSKIENEIQILKSRTLITNVVKDLKLNVRYFSEGRILEIENYPKSLVEINFLSHDSIVHTKAATFHVRINSNTSFSFLNKKGEKLSDHSFGNTVSSSVGDIVITPSIENVESNSGTVIKIQISPVKFVAEGYRNRLAIYPVGSSSLVGVSLNDPVREKAKDIINNLVDEYNEATIENKKQISARTANFINERLDLISGDLSEVDDEAAGYKSRFGLTNDVEAQTQRVADIDSRNVQEIAQLSTQLSLIESMRRFVLSQEGRYDLIPANLGFNEATITNTVSRYNGLILQRKRLLKTSSEQNPVVVNIDQQIDGLRQVLIGSLNSLKGSIDIRLKSLRTQDQYFSGKLYNAPIRQKDLRVIEREQTIKEQLYLYLLQKREEAEITSHITLSNARVIDRASTLNSYPVSPNKRIIYAGALFIGFLIPFMIIYLSDLLNVKITSREDLEKVLSMPIIGAIPKVKSKSKIVISPNDRSGVAEAFRILRTNLDFLMAGTSKDRGRVIFVTSTISGEGKTMISSNLAKTLAITGKKVVYLGTDLRDPKFHQFLDLPEGKDTKGLTNFIMNSDLSPKDVIFRDSGDSPLDVVSSGAIPPNPAELLMHERVGKMFEYLRENYDYIVVDTSPVSLVADTLLIGHFADLCIYIVRENYSDKRILQMPQSFYTEKRLPNIAVLLNAAGNQAGYNYGYGYGNKKN
ncbi:polysaccharide biosynthesis tyrosine autokinase [Aquimarina gracilis]|uniref:non-specific protein-tyrosine kinase n=1 Tax=Aquimarina gracilis TaxID=874422 RepID=A0ABU6A2A5_9FLAO|nr:polysaccharide biosynthesis tyrosine autokinase [Aquimarina gracilis]MEB3348216.1 polysaccharide biosynthesis tyrosine autokinase [Aquimarina gracilis]